MVLRLSSQETKASKNKDLEIEACRQSRDLRITFPSFLSQL